MHSTKIGYVEPRFVRPRLRKGEECMPSCQTMSPLQCTQQIEIDLSFVGGPSIMYSTKIGCVEPRFVRPRLRKGEECMPSCQTMSPL